MKTVLSLFALLALLIPVSCGESEAGAADETKVMSKLEEVLPILKTIKDKASWDTAKPKLEGIVKAVTDMTSAAAKKAKEAAGDAKDKGGDMMNKMKDAAGKMGGDLLKGLGDKINPLKGKVGEILNGLKDQPFLGELKGMLAKIGLA